MTRHAPPFLPLHRRTPAIMADVCLALIPPATAAVWFFGWRAVWLLLTAALVSIATDLLSTRLLHGTLARDGASLVTGLIFGLSCPADTPLWLVALLSFTAVAVFRDAFGGIGCNLYNPAMAARVLLLTVFPAYASGYALPDSVSAATPLADTAIPLSQLIVGRVGGCIGETSALMIGLGLLYLLCRRVIHWRIPCLSLAAFAVTVTLCGGDALRQLLSGSILFGAVYIFTDYTGRPTTAVGEAVFAVGVGTLTALLRSYGIYPEGVCFAVLGMNLLTPALEWATRPSVYGGKRKEKPA